MGDALVYLGRSTFTMAVLLLCSCLPLLLLISGRPHGRRRWAEKKAGTRVTAIASALVNLDEPWPEAKVAAWDARRRRVQRRILLLLTPVYVVGTIGCVMAAAGVFVLHAPWRSDVNSSDQWEVRLIPLMGLYFALVFALIWLHKRVSGGVAHLYAAHSLLRAMELTMESRRDDTLDAVGVRRELAGQLGLALSYLQRYVGKVLPLGVRGDARTAVVRHAKLLAAAVREYQVIVAIGSRSDIAALTPAIGRIVAALVDGRLGDLPRAAPALRPASAAQSVPQAGPVTPSTESGAELPRVFLCHSKSDRDKVRILYERLRADGLRPWLDEEDVLPGQDWNDVIRQAIQTSRHVIVCMSAASVGRRGYHQKEIRSALEVSDEYPDGSRYLIPVRLEPCDTPHRLARYQWVDIFNPDGYERLLRAVRPE